MKKELPNSFTELGMYLGTYHIFSTQCIRISFLSLQCEANNPVYQVKYH